MFVYLPLTIYKLHLLFGVFSPLFFFIPTNLTLILKSITKKHIWFLSIIYFHSKTTSRHEKQEDQNKNEASVLS